MKKEKAIITLLVLFLLNTSLISTVSASEGSAKSAISSTKNTIGECYNSVLHAEATGADVNSLMVTLNDAADLLSKAELAYAAGDFDSAYTYASQSQSILSGFTAEASTLQQNAVAAKSQTAEFSLLSLFISIAILVSGVATWFMLKKNEKANKRESPTI